MNRYYFESKHNEQQHIINQLKKLNINHSLTSKNAECIYELICTKDQKPQIEQILNITLEEECEIKII